MLQDYLNVMVLFLVVGLGMLLAKLNWLNLPTNNALTKILLNVALPSTLILSIGKDFSRNEFLALLPDIILPTSVILLLMVMASVVAKLIKVEPSDKGLFIGLCAMSSTIFFGIPVTLAVFGSHGLPYALMTYASQTVIYWTLGLYLLEKGVEVNTPKHGKVVTAVKEIFNMPLIAFFIGVGILLMGLTMPGVIASFLGSLSGMTSALAMLIVGTIIFISGVKNIRITRALCIVIAFRFIVAPLAVLSLGWLFSTSGQMIKITMLICALPIPNATVILAEKYNINVPFATGALTCSIGIYLIFLPVILFCIHHI